MVEIPKKIDIVASGEFSEHAALTSRFGLPAPGEAPHLNVEAALTLQDPTTAQKPPHRGAYNRDDQGTGGQDADG
jgi:hypothetical protein